MIMQQTMLDVADNSGAKTAMCFRVLGGATKRYATLGDQVMCAVKSADANGTVKKGEKVLGVVVRTKHAVKRTDGSWVRFDNNSLVIIDKEKNPRGTRIFGPVARELRARGYARILSLAAEVV